MVLLPRRASPCVAGVAEQKAQASWDASVPGRAHHDGAAGRPSPADGPRNSVARRASNSHSKPYFSSWRHDCAGDAGVLGWRCLLSLWTPARSVVGTPAQAAGDKIAPPPDANPVLLVQQASPITRQQPSRGLRSRGGTATSRGMALTPDPGMDGSWLPTYVVLIHCSGHYQSSYFLGIGYDK